MERIPPLPIFKFISYLTPWLSKAMTTKVTKKKSGKDLQRKQHVPWRFRLNGK